MQELVRIKLSENPEPSKRTIGKYGPDTCGCGAVLPMITCGYLIQMGRYVMYVQNWKDNH